MMHAAGSEHVAREKHDKPQIAAEKVKQQFDQTLYNVMKVIPNQEAQLQQHLCDKRGKKRRDEKGEKDKKEESVSQIIHSLKNQILSVRKLEEE